MSIEKKRILIVEDNPGLARVLAFKFKSCGFDPISCANGGDAWQTFRDHPSDAIVTDHEMPVMSGIDLIAKVRQQIPGLPCFLVTGRQLELSHDPRVMELNLDGVFGKPFSPGSVVAAVAEAIDRRERVSNDQESRPHAPFVSKPTFEPPSAGRHGANS